MATATRFQHFVLTLTAAAQPLSNALGNTAIGGPDDVACRAISLFSPSGNDAVYIGGKDGLTTSVYGFSIAAGDLISIGLSFDAGPLKPSDVYAVGTAGNKLHFTIVPF